MATDLTSQKAAHQFFIDRLKDDRTFTKEEVMAVTGWDKSSADTYWSKQFKGFLDSVPGGYRVRENFRPYVNWRKFRTLATQVKVVVTEYKVEKFSRIVCFEFYLPLTHEGALRISLDSLFYRDVVEPRLKRIGRAMLKANGFDEKSGESDESFYSRVLELVDDKFGGYSIYHVNGRFRATGLSTLDQALEMQNLAAGTSLTKRLPSHDSSFLALTRMKLSGLGICSTSCSSRP